MANLFAAALSCSSKMFGIHGTAIFRSNYVIHGETRYLSALKRVKAGMFISTYIKV